MNMLQSHRYYDKQEWGGDIGRAALSGATAGLTQGLTQYIDKVTNGAIGAGNIKVNPNATLTQRLTSALYESAISTATNTTIQSLFNKESSFKDILKRQAVNTGVGGLATVGAQEIGKQYHTNGFSDNTFINKTTQLLLHAGLGAVSNKLTGNDALSGAISGVSGEIFAEILGNSLYKTTDGNQLTKDQKDLLKEVGGLAGGLSALITGKLSGLNDKDIGNNMFAGQRVGSNAVENNLTSVLMNKDRTKGVVVDAKKDGNTDIIDQDGKVVGKTYSDEEFVNGTCLAGKCTIHFDVSLDFKGLAFDIDNSSGFWSTRDNIKTNGVYDLKNSLIDLGYTNNKMDGILNYNTGVVMNGDTAGNYLYGLALANMGLPYYFTKKFADDYHNKSNNVKTGETPEATKAIKDGYNSIGNTNIFESFLNFDYFNQNKNKDKAKNNVINNIKFNK